MCDGSELRISTSSARSLGESPAAGSSNRMKRRGARERKGDLELALFAVAQLRHQSIAYAREMHCLDEIDRRLHERVVAPGRSREKRPRDTPRHAR